MAKSMTIGQRINIYRLQRNMTMQKLAKAINISISTYYGWLYRGAHPDIDSLIMIADLFDMSLDDLVGREYHGTKFDELSEIVAYIKNNAVLDSDDTTSQARGG